MSTLADNKRNVIAFYDLMFNQCQPRAEAIERYRRGGVHGSTTRGSATAEQAFVAYFERMAAEFPGKQVEVKSVPSPKDDHGRAALPPDLARRRRSTPGSTSSASTTTASIVEHWDVLQLVPDHSQNDNGLF